MITCPPENEERDIQLLRGLPCEAHGKRMPGTLPNVTCRDTVFFRRWGRRAHNAPTHNECTISSHTFTGTVIFSLERDKFWEEVRGFKKKKTTSHEKIDALVGRLFKKCIESELNLKRTSPHPIHPLNAMINVVFVYYFFFSRSSLSLLQSPFSSDPSPPSRPPLTRPTAD